VGTGTAGGETVKAASSCNNCNLQLAACSRRQQSGTDGAVPVFGEWLYGPVSHSFLPIFVAPARSL